LNKSPTETKDYIQTEKLKIRKGSVFLFEIKIEKTPETETD
jgi:hypothetical protein